MKILLTVAALDGFHGSVIHVLEWASFFRSEGHDVTVVTGIYRTEVKELFHKNNIVVSKVDDAIDLYGWSLGISYHFPIITKLLQKGVEFQKLIAGCLSSFELLESPPCFWEKCNLIVTMSLEAKQRICDRYAIPFSKVVVIENGIPKHFFRSYKEETSKNIQHIGVVSNHIPCEIYELKKYLKGLAKVHFIGMHGDVCELVTPEMLKKFDVIITIGKTVQYCLGLGIPVYEYDHFGGNGYITQDNFSKGDF